MSKETQAFRVNEAVALDLGDVTEQFAYRAIEPSLYANEVSDSDLRVSIKNALTKYLLDASHARSPHVGDSACSCYVYCDVMHVFEETVVYYHAGKTWSIAYSKTDEDTGAVEISGEPEEVRPITQYVVAEAHEDDDEDIDSNDESDDESDVFNRASESFAASVLKKLKQRLGMDLTSDVTEPHTSEVEQRSSESNPEVSVTNSPETETSAAIEENTEMAQENKNPRAEAIAKLVANEHVAYTDADAEWLAELSDKAFERVSTIAFEQAEATEAAAADETASETVETSENAASDIAPAAETKTEPAKETVSTPSKPKTAEEYIASLDAPKEIARMFERAIEADKALRSDLVKKIKANASNKFSDKQLTAMDTDMLESLAALATPPADFSGNGNHTVRRANTRKEDDTVEPIRMPGLSFGLGSRRNA